jgi:hypothetical protein
VRFAAFSRIIHTLPGWILALAACRGAGSDEPPRLAPRDGRRERDDAIVALYNGEPLRWRAVAERMLEIDPRTAVETYVRWRVVDDRRRELGIAPTADELRRRAEVHVARARSGLGEKEFQARLAADGLTEREYVEKLAGSDYMRQTLTLDLLVREQRFVDGTLTIDRVAFAVEADARRFAASAREGGFDAAAEGLGGARGVRRLPRETFARSAPPADPLLDRWIVEALDALQPGQMTDVESSRTELKYVARLVEKKPGTSKPYAERGAELLESVLKDPPGPEEVRAWLASRVAAAKIEYPAKAANN